jgi:hypothetical protein
MIVGDDLGEHRHCDLARALSRRCSDQPEHGGGEAFHRHTSRQLGVGGSGTWLAAHHRDITSFAVEQLRQDRVTVGCVVITQHYRVCSGQPSRTKIIKGRRVEEQRCPTPDHGRQIEQRPRSGCRSQRGSARTQAARRTTADLSVSRTLPPPCCPP